MKSASLILFVLIIQGAYSAEAQNRYAILIGINNYIKPDTSRHDLKLCRTHPIKDLPCCENDVKVMNVILTSRFGFQQDNIAILLNENATNAGIHKSIADILGKCEKGDVFFFYFAGHGSYMYNKYSPEPDKLDETLVTADAVYAGNDIRDKEIALILQSFINKGVTVTAMFECCHSGSMARGLDFVEQRIEASNEIIADEKTYPQPEKNGALIIGACQDFQVEIADPFPPDNKYYSLFTKAFSEAMKRSNSTISASDIVNSIAVQLKNWGRSIVPSIAGTEERKNGPLFGGQTVSTSSNHIVVQNILPGNSIVLQGGTALGLEQGTELVNENKTIKLEVVGKSDLSESKATVIKGNALEVKAGSIFRISRYSYSTQNKLQLCVPVISMNRSGFFQLKDNLCYLLAEKKIKIQGDANAPTDYWLFFNKSKWFLESGKNEIVFSAKLNLDSLSNFLETGKTIRVQWPVYPELFKHIKSIINDQYSCVNITTMNNSDYVVSGTFLNNRLNYRLTKTLNDTSVTAEYPLQSNLYIVDTLKEKNVADSIGKTAWKLGKIKSWLNLESTGGADNFPYSIYLKNTSTKKMIQSGTVKNGEQYEPYLVKNNKMPKQDSIAQRWIYIFDISADGSITLLYPYGSNNENHYPINPKDSIEEIPTDTIIVAKPFGIDHIICLTSADPLPNPKMIEQAGIATRGISDNPLEELIGSMNERTRGVNVVKTPEAWSIQKIRFKSVSN